MSQIESVKTIPQQLRNIGGSNEYLRANSRQRRGSRRINYPNHFKQASNWMAYLSFAAMAGIKQSFLLGLCCRVVLGVSI